jgi:hypothetical protein
VSLPLLPVRTRDNRREIRNVFIDRGDADDLAATLSKSNLHPRVYPRSLRAELQSTLIFVVVADKEP